MQSIGFRYLPVELLVVQVAESDVDQPLVLSACTYNVELAPADKPLRDLDIVVRSTHGDKSPESVRYFFAPGTGPQVHMIDDQSPSDFVVAGTEIAVHLDE